MPIYVYFVFFLLCQCCTKHTPIPIYSSNKKKTIGKRKLRRFIDELKRIERSFGIMKFVSAFFLSYFIRLNNNLPKSLHFIINDEVRF